MIEWGSVADWVSGIGTLAAVFVALFLYWREREDKKRQYIDNVIVSYSGGSAAPGDDLYSVSVSVVNTGGAPIPYAALLGPEDVEGQQYLRLHQWVKSTSVTSHLGGSRQDVISPGGTARALYTYPASFVADEFLIIIQDAGNNTWFREVRAKRYISRPKALRRYPMLTDGSIFVDGDVL